MTEVLQFTPECNITTTPMVYKVSRRHNEEYYLFDPSGTVLARRILIQAQFTDAGYWLVTSPGTLAYGAGETKNDAHEDLITMMQDIYEELKDCENLSTFLLDELAHLSKVLVN